MGLDHDLLRAAAPEMRFHTCKEFCSKEDILLVRVESGLEATQ